MNKWFLPFSIIIVCFILLFLNGCANNPWRPSRNWDPWWRSDLERSFGDSYNYMLANQPNNPDASKNLAPVVGVDGKTAEEIMKKYQKSYSEKEAAPTYIFNVGQGAGASK